MKTLLKQPVVIASITILIVILLIWWFVLISPAQSKLSSIHKQEQNDQIRILTLQEQLNTLKAEKGVIKKEKPFLTKVFPAAFPYNPKRPAIVLTLAVLAQSTHVSLTDISNFTTESWNGYVVDPITMEIQGSTADDMIFLADLYKLKRVITISSLQITPQSTGTTPILLRKATFNIQAYAYTSRQSTPPPSSFQPLQPKHKK